MPFLGGGGQRQRRPGRASAENIQCLPSDSLRQVPAPGKTRRGGREKAKTHYRSPAQQTQGPTPEDLVSGECQVLGHGKGSITVVFPFLLPLPGKYQPSVKSVFTCAILGGQAELVDGGAKLVVPLQNVGSAQEVPFGSHFINLPLPGIYPQEKESPAGQSPGNLSWSSVIIY